MTLVPLSTRFGRTIVCLTILGTNAPLTASNFDTVNFTMFATVVKAAVQLKDKEAMER